MKKIISLLLSFILVFSTIQVVFADTNGSMSNFKKTKTYTDGQFTDVSTTYWFAENVKNAYELGLVSGTSETTFAPFSYITFAESVALCCRIHNIYNGNNYEFKNSTPWYQTYFDYSNENRLIPFELEYNSQVTRREFAWIFYYALPLKELEPINNIAFGTIPDVDYDDPVVYTLYNAGILCGSDEYGTFNNFSPIKRAEVAAIITRLVDKSSRKEFMLK